MNNYDYLSTLGFELVVLLPVFFLILVAIFVADRKHKRHIEDLDRYRINATTTIDKSIPELFDLIIEESFLDYQIKTALFNEGVINSEKEDNIRKDLAAMVSQRMSEAVLEKLSLFYNMESLSDILADKIYIAVMNFVVTHNRSLVEDDTK